MNAFPFSRIIAALPLLCTLFPTFTKAQELYQLSGPVIVDAVPVRQGEPHYPAQDANNGKEGWVVLSYVIEPNGKVSHPIIESSSGSKRFESEAVKAVKKWIYQPATYRGQPIVQSKNSVQINFKQFESNLGVSKNFFKLYQNYANANNNNDNVTKMKTLAQIAKVSVNLNIENFYQHIALAEKAKIEGQIDQQLTHLNLALRYSGINNLLAKRTLNQKEKQVISELERAAFNMLHQKMRLEINASQYAQALQTISYIMALPIARSHQHYYASQQANISTLIDSSTVIKSSLAISPKGPLAYQLLRPSFKVNTIDGRLTKLDVRCRNSFQTYAFTRKKQWTIPKNWQDCSLYFYGEPNTHFTVEELPRSS